MVCTSAVVLSGLVWGKVVLHFGFELHHCLCLCKTCSTFFTLRDFTETSPEIWVLGADIPEWYKEAEDCINLLLFNSLSLLCNGTSCSPQHIQRYCVRLPWVRLEESSCSTSGCLWPRYEPSSSLWSSSFLSEPRQTSV